MEVCHKDLRCSHTVDSSPEVMEHLEFWAADHPKANPGLDFVEVQDQKARQQDEDHFVQIDGLEP